MHKNTKKSLSTKFRTVIGVFSVLGLTIVSLGVLAISKTATSTDTNLESQAYSGWSGDVQLGVYQAGNRQTSVNKAGYNPATTIGTRPNPPPQTTSTEPTANLSQPSETESLPTYTGGNEQPPNEIPHQGARPNNPTQQGATIPFEGDTIAQTTTSVTTQTTPAQSVTTNTQQTTSTGTPVTTTTSSGGSSSSSGSSNKPLQSQEPRNDGTESTTTNAVACKEYILTQLLIRGGQGWARGVPIDAAGNEQWAKAEAFRMVIDLRANKNLLPGGGKIQAYHAHVNPLTGIFVQYLARDNRFYVKRVPTFKGKINWVTEAQYPWEEYNFGQTQNVPTGGNVTGWGMFPIAAGTDGQKYVTFNETLVRDKRTYFNTGLWDKYANGKLSQESDGKYELIADLNSKPTSLPGSGEVQGQSDYVAANGTMLHQSWYRGDIGYVRDVPIENGKPVFSKAGGITAVVDLNANPKALPGDGDFEAVANYVSCLSN